MLSSMKSVHNSKNEILEQKSIKQLDQLQRYYDYMNKKL